MHSPNPPQPPVLYTCARRRQAKQGEEQAKSGQTNRTVGIGPCLSEAATTSQTLIKEIRVEADLLDSLTLEEVVSTAWGENAHGSAMYQLAEKA